MNFKSTITLLLSVSLVTPGYAQTVTTTKQVVPAPVNNEEDEVPSQVKPKEGATLYDLSQILQKVLDVSPSIESARYDKEFAEAQLSEAKAASILPVLDLKVLGGVTPDVPDGAGPGSSFPPVDTSINNLGPFMQIRVEGFIPIFTFGKLSNLRRAASVGVDAKDQGINKARNELIYQVKKAYVGLTTLYSLKDFLLELQSRADKAKEIVQKKISQRSSDVTNIDLMRIDVFIAETERRMIDINNGIDLILATLKVLMALPRDQQIDIVDQRLHMDATVIQPLDAYMEIAKKNRPDIMQLENMVDARESGMKIASSSFYPTLGVAGFYRYALAPGRPDIRNPFLVDEFNFNSGGGFLVLSQSLSFFLTKSRWKQAKAQYRKAVSDQQRALQGIELEIRKAHNVAISKQQSVESAKKAFKSGRSWVLATTLNLGVGVTPPKDLLEAFVGYSTVKVNYLQTISDYYMAMADLSNAIGQEVTNIKY